MSKKSIKKDNVVEDESIKTIWIRLPYMGNHGESLTNKLLRKLRRCFKIDVKFKVLYDTRKLSSFCTTKDRIPFNQMSSVIYKIKCPGCGEKYIGKSERCFGIRMYCQGTRDNEPMFKHLHNCNEFHDLCKMFAINDVSANKYTYNIDNYILQAVLDNSKILKRFKHSIQLEFVEAYYIKLINPTINTGIAASKELVIFK